MKIRYALLGGVAAAALVATAAPALAATPACASACTSLTSVQIPGDAQFVVVPGSDGNATQAKVGDRVIQRKGTTTESNEDFGPNGSAKLVSAYCNTKGPQHIKGWLCSNEPGYQALEMEWMPKGTPSSLCAGVARDKAGQYVTLQKCGTLRTLWITSGSESPLTFVPSTGLLNMSVTSKGNEVLAVPNYGYPQMFSFDPGT